MGKVVSTPQMNTLRVMNTDEQRSAAFLINSEQKAQLIAAAKANADGLQQRLLSAGYDAQIAYNSGNNMYRVVASTYDSKASAVQSRNQLRSQYADAWLLSK